MTVVHDEFLGMGLSGVSGFLGAGAVVVDVQGCVLVAMWESSMRRGWGKDFKSENQFTFGVYRETKSNT